TFTFSEVPVGFTESDIQVSAGLSLVAGSLAVDASDPSGIGSAAWRERTYNFSGTGTVTMAAASYTDAALNDGGAGQDSVPIDTANPTVVVNVVDSSLGDSNVSSVVTFTFSEVPVGFTESDIQVSAGLSLVAGSLAVDASDPSGKTFTATIAGTHAGSGTTTRSRAAGRYTDAALNHGGPAQ